METFKAIFYVITLIITAFFLLLELVDLQAFLLGLSISATAWGLIWAIFFIIKKIQNKNWIKAGLVILNICILAAFIICQLTIAFILAFKEETTPKEPELTEYSKSIETITDKSYAISHFPKEIPFGAKNYYLHIDKDFHGYNIDYLKFNMDKNYIDETIKKYKNEIYKKIKFEDISEYYQYLDSLVDYENKNKDSYYAYILKNKNNDNNYTSGFLASKETSEIIFFFANWNLKNEN